MKRYVTIADDGLTVEAVYTCHQPPDEAAIEVPMAFSQAALLRCYFAGGYLTPRPEIAPPVVSGGVVTLGACPPGTLIDVYDITVPGGADPEPLASVTAEDGVPLDPFDLSEPGRYQFQIDPPWPWLDAVFTVEVAQ